MCYLQTPLPAHNRRGFFPSPQNMYYVLTLASASHMYWCGYEPNPASPGGGCHRWLPGQQGLENAVRFCREEDAARSGVGAPNTPYGPADTVPGRGVVATRIHSRDLPK
jgi:hypothetical protein